MKPISTTTTPPDTVQLKLQYLAQHVSYYSINYFFSAVILILTYPFSEKTIAPILNAIVPISHCTLPKALLIFTVMYWLPIIWDAARRWHRNDF
jgi:hypothetical protein